MRGASAVPPPKGGAGKPAPHQSAVKPLTASPAGEAKPPGKKLLHFFPDGLFYILINLIRYNNPLILRIKTAQTRAGHDAHRGTGPLGVNAVVQQLGGGLVVALA